jgi:hypothetical protein
MKPEQKTIIFIVLCSFLGAILLLWLGIESYPTLNKPSHYVGHALTGLFLGYLFGVLGLLLKIGWNFSKGEIKDENH